MKFEPRRFRLVLALVTLIAAGSCGILGPELDQSGIVKLLDLEGGCWVIESEGDVFFPINLTDQFKVDGMWVVFEGKRVEGASFCPGELIELEKIGALPE